jgi:glycosyl transferase family 25
MKIFIINLERRLDKLERIKERISKIELNNENIEIVKAVDGNKIDNEYLNKNGYCINKEWRDNTYRRSIKSGEIGCSISHYNAWKRIIEDDIEFAIILEDDAVFSDKYKEIIKKVTNYIGVSLSNLDPTLPSEPSLPEIDWSDYPCP